MVTGATSRLAGLVAYPSTPSDIGETIRLALLRLRRAGVRNLRTWEENDIAGRFVVTPILDMISKGDVLIADISIPNFNVTYEIGFAIGSKKRILLARNAAYMANDPVFLSVGLFDTLGYFTYQNADDIVEKITALDDLTPITFDSHLVNRTSPLFILLPRIRSDAVSRILARVHRARLKYRSFDPEEHGRLAAREAIENVASSHGIIAPLVSLRFTEATVHNLRAAFVAGLAHAMEKELLLLQSGEDPVPLDYRDLVKVYFSTPKIDDYIARFSSSVTARLQAEGLPLVKEPRSFFEQLSLGASSAENEEPELAYYYVETDEFQRALQGEAQIVVGRKGTGKTALFVQLANTLRGDKDTLVLALKPDAAQFLRLRRQVINLLAEGTKEHALIAFWEYLLLLEICNSILEQDFLLHIRDHRLYPIYRMLADNYGRDRNISEADFAERLDNLVSRLVADFRPPRPRSSNTALANSQLTELLYRHDIHVLRSLVLQYLAQKGALWILIDNLDKGWPPRGVEGEDVRIITCLLEALSKLGRNLQKHHSQVHSLLFIRNDVFELLVDFTTDRGKISTIKLDWTDPELLREVLRRRMTHTGVKRDATFEEIWRQICVTHIQGEESSQYLIDRCLMRPRGLIELVRMAKSHAVNLKHEKVTEDDILAGETEYSHGLVRDIGLEIRDIFPDAPPDFLYIFSEGPKHLSFTEIDEKLTIAFRTAEERGHVLELLLWYGFVGVIRGSDDARYIYHFGYDLRRLLGPWKTAFPSGAIFEINPAFWSGLGTATQARSA